MTERSANSEKENHIVFIKLLIWFNTHFLSLRFT